MASRRIAKRAARKKSRRVYRTNIRQPKGRVVKKFSNFVGKSTYVAVRRKRTRGRRQRRTRQRRYSRRRGYRRNRRRR